MNILVTGAAGYIGSVLVPELLKKGHRVTAIDNFMYNQATLLDCCHDKSLIVVRGDARDKNLVSGYLKEADAIFPRQMLLRPPFLGPKFPDLFTQLVHFCHITQLIK